MIYTHTFTLYTTHIHCPYTLYYISINSCRHTYIHTIYSLSYTYAIYIYTYTAYPAMNSTEKVSKHTLAIMQQEFSYAHILIKSIISNRDKKTFNIQWGKLFEPSDFFLKYNHYLGISCLSSILYIIQYIVYYYT